MKIRWAIATVGVIALAALTITTQMPWLTQPHPEMVQQEAPIVGASDSTEPMLSCPADAKPANLDFTMKDVEGKDVSLQSYKGKVILLDFWATWCGPCVAGLPKVAEVAAKLKDQGVVFVAVNLGENQKTVEAFLAKKELAITVALADQKVGTRFGVNGIPHSVIVGKDGVVRTVHVGFGPGSEKQLEKDLLAAIGQKVDEPKKDEKK